MGHDEGDTEDEKPEGERSDDEAAGTSAGHLLTSRSSASCIAASGSSSETRGWPGASSRTSRNWPSRAFLSCASARRAVSGSTRAGRGLSALLHLGPDAPVQSEVVLREAERGGQAERNRVAVPKLVSACRFQRVRERVAEIEDRPLPLLEADRGDTPPP